MRFLADENISRHVIERLRAAGVDVTLVPAMHAGSPGDQVLALAVREGRILVTDDRDFGEMILRQRLPVRGLMLLELDRLSSSAEAERVVDAVA